MEHWGLVGYRGRVKHVNYFLNGIYFLFFTQKETSLLYSENRNSLSDKQGVAYTIAHEISHFVKN